MAAHLAHFHTKWGFSIKKVYWISSSILEGHRFTTTNCMGTFEVDLKKLDLNTCINGMSPKHRLKNHFIGIGVLLANSPRKIEMQKDSDCRLIVIPPRLNGLRIKPSCHLVAPAGCRIASRRPLVAPPSRQLVVQACCRIASPSSRCAPRRTLVLSLRRLVVALPLDASPSRRLVVSSCRLSLSCRASWLSRHHLLSSSRCTALSSSHSAGWLLHCLSLRCPLILLS